MKKLIAMVLAMLMILSCVSAMAEGDVLTAGCNPEWAPFEIMDDNGQIVGFDADLVAEIAKRTGLNIQMENTNFDSIVSGVQSGLYSMGVSGISINEERLANVDFSIPYYDNSMCCIVKVGSSVTDNDSLMGLKVGTQSGTTGVEQAEMMAGEDNVYTYTTALNAVMDLQGNKLDAVITDMAVGQNILKQLNDENLIIIDTVVFDPDQYAIALQKGSELKAPIDEAIQSMIDDGTIDALAAKWGLYGEVEEEVADEAAEEATEETTEDTAD